MSDDYSDVHDKSLEWEAFERNAEHHERLEICRELARERPFSVEEFYEYGERIRLILSGAGIPYSAAIYRDTLAMAANTSVELGIRRLGV